MDGIMKDAERKCEVAERDYKAGANDCKNGVYDKWYRYNRTDDGAAYDAGWVNENKVVQNEKVTFIPCAC